MQGKNRRRLERFEIAVPAQIAVAVDNRRRTMHLITHDISAGGAFFQTDTLLPVGTEVLIELTLLAELFRNVKPPSQALIRLAGKVLRHDFDGMAIGFTEHFQIQPVALNPARTGGGLQ